MSNLIILQAMAPASTLPANNTKLFNKVDECVSWLQTSVIVQKKTAGFSLYRAFERVCVFINIIIIKYFRTVYVIEIVQGCH